MKKVCLLLLLLLLLLLFTTISESFSQEYPSLFSWGRNDIGQLGDGALLKYRPRQAGNESGWETVVSGLSASLAIKADGTLWTWGRSTYPTLEEGRHRITPVQIGSENSWISIAAGDGHFMALKADGTLWAFGSNAQGQIGNGEATQPNADFTQVGTDADWASVSGGGEFTVAIKTDGSLWAWGKNDKGQLGDNSLVGKTLPTRIGTDTNWKAVSCGRLHTIALKEDGTLWAWGDNFHGQLGNGSRSRSLYPEQSGTEADWATIMTGSFYSMALKADNTLWVWGRNSSGELGGGSSYERYQPEQLGTSTWSKVATGNYHVIAINTDGTLWSWGENNNGELGDGTNIDRRPPLQIGTATDWVTASAGSYFSIAIKSNGTRFVWGANYDGQLGDGEYVYDTRVKKATSITGWAALSAGNNYSLGIKEDGTLWAWGSNSYYMLGDGLAVNHNKNVPAQIGESNDWKVVSASVYHNMAIKQDGTLWAWGDNQYGRLGDGTTRPKNEPIQIGTDTDWATVSTGYYHTVAIKTDGSLWAWGLNAWGQLGDGTNTDKRVPTQIGTDTDWASVSGAELQTFAIKTNGSLWGWGSNHGGMFGDGSTMSKNSPFQIGTASDWVCIDSRAYHALAIKSNGTLWSWGSNFSGQLGNGNNENSMYPLQIGTDTNWSMVKTGVWHSIAIKTDSSMYAWGDNRYGQLGDATAVNRNVPLKIGTAAEWVAVGAGQGHSLAVLANTASPVLLKPQQNSSGSVNFEVKFNLPKPSLAGTVQLVFTRTGGAEDQNAPHILSLDTEFESAGLHTLWLNGNHLSSSAGVAMVSSAPNDRLMEGATYKVSLIYQFSEMLSPLQDENTGFTYDLTPPPAPAKPLVTGENFSGNDIADYIIKDTTPEITGTAEPGANITLYLNETEFANSITDEDGNWTYAVPSGSALANGLFQLKVTATDGAGNISTFSEFTTIIIDTQAPVIQTKSFLLLLNAEGNATLLLEDVEAGTSDNLTPYEDLVFLLNKTSFSCSDIGVHSVRMSVTDLAGNLANAHPSVTVADRIEPVVVPKNISLQLNAQGEAFISVEDVDGGSSDNCSIVRKSLSKTTFSCSDLGQNEILLWIFDRSDNMATTTAIVTIEDVTPPLIVADQEFEIMENSASGTIIGTLVASDNCAVTGFSFSEGHSSDLFVIDPNTGTIAVKDAAILDFETDHEYLLSLSAMDQAGNTSTTTVLVRLKDINEAPDLEALQAVEGDELSLISFTAYATDVDNASIDLQFSLNENTPSGASIDSATGLFSWTPTEEQGPQIYTFQVLVSDGALTDEKEVKITVNEVNQAPIITSEAPSSLRTEEMYEYTVTATDGDLPVNSLKYEALEIPSWLTFNVSTQTLSGIPDSEAEQNNLIRLQVSDGIELVNQEFILVVDTPTGINERSNQNHLLVYPNPTQGQLYFNFSGIDAEEKAIISLLTLEGKILLLKEENLENCAEVVSNYLQKAKTGVYLLQIKTRENFKSIRVIKK